MNLPEELKYTKQHEGIKLDGETATIGITDFAQNQLTDIVFVDLPEKGKQVEKDKVAMVVESVKSVSDIFSPLSGEIEEVNSELSDNPEQINKDPYDKGWMFKLKLSKKEEYETLMSAEDYKKFVEEKGN